MSTSTHEKVAEQFIKDIRAHEKDQNAPSYQQVSSATKSVAVIWSPEKTSALKDILPRSSNITINTILLNVSDKQLIKSAQTPTPSLKGDILFTSIDSARNMGFRVFLMTPFRFTTRYPEGPLAKGQESDIFSPQVKKNILSFYRDIARYPLHGIYVNEIAYGTNEGFTPYAIATYQDAFSERLEAKTHSSSSLRWRFAGLKSRHITKILIDIWAEIQGISSEMELGVAVPEILLMDPAKGLMETSLDYLELAEARFDFYVVSATESGAQRVAESLLRYGKLEKVWFQKTKKETLNTLLEMPIQGIIMMTSPI
jgi:hypothetical protein